MPNREFRRRNGVGEYKDSGIMSRSSLVQIFVMGVGYGFGFLLALVFLYAIVFSVRLFV